jgi:glutathione synthase/RimK-type ligase-like ATP-grasp enzyme
MYTKPFYIVVNPVYSKFAKTLQTKLRDLVTNKVYRRSEPCLIPYRRNFFVTQQPLNKIEQLVLFKAAEISHPPFVTDPSKIAELGTKTIFARRLINSTGGKGIVEFNREDQAVPPQAPLYVAYIPKKAEYRYHVFNSKVIDIQQKKKKRGWDERNTRIRNITNGYVYCRDRIDPPTNGGELAVRAVASLGYTYGAVDIIYNEKNNMAYVLEVNSRPGLMGTTLNRYVEAIINTYELRRK